MIYLRDKDNPDDKPSVQLGMWLSLEYGASIERVGDELCAVSCGKIVGRVFRYFDDSHVVELAAEFVGGR